MEGCIHIYCGDGKGKTSAALGLAVRAAGSGLRVMITRFLKTDFSGEVKILAEIPGISVTPCEKNFGFFTRMTPGQKEEASAWYEKLMRRTFDAASGEEWDVLILDEIMAVCNYGLVKEEEVLKFLKSRPPGLEVVLTGRDPSGALISLADYVSEIKKIKHPYDNGIDARKGIEY